MLKTAISANIIILLLYYYYSLTITILHSYITPPQEMIVNQTVLYIIFTVLVKITWAPPWSSGSVLNHRSLPPVFESRRGHI